jgi:hypothetical protein
MNEAMKTAWLQISAMMENPDTTELDIFLRTWQLAIQAQREIKNDQNTRTEETS